MRNTELARGRIERPTPGAPAKKTGRRKEPLFLVILGLLVLGVLLVVLVGRTGDPSRETSLRDLEARVQKMEQKLVKLEVLDHRIFQLEQKTGEHSLLLMERMDRLEKSVASSKEQKMEEKKPAPPKREDLPRQQAEPPKPVEPPKTAKEAVHHQVLEGETLYRISRTYGLSVDELLRMNNLSPGSPIRKGQRLRVGPAEGR